MHADYLPKLDEEDKAIVGNVAEVERKSGRVVLYHSCSVYIVFLAAVYDALLFDRPVSLAIDENGNSSYAMANLTWRVFKGPF